MRLTKFILEGNTRTQQWALDLPNYLEACDEIATDDVYAIGSEDTGIWVYDWSINEELLVASWQDAFNWMRDQLTGVEYEISE